MLVDGSIEEAPRPPTPGATTRLTWLGGTIAAVPGLLRTAGAALLEDAAYLGMAADLHAVRAWNPLPHVPIVVLAATRTGATHWERRWLRRQEEWAARFDAELDAEQPGESDVRFEVVRRSGHRVMRDAPESITAAVRSLDAGREVDSRGADAGEVDSGRAVRPAGRPPIVSDMWDANLREWSNRVRDMRCPSICWSAGASWGE